MRDASPEFNLHGHRVLKHLTPGDSFENPTTKAQTKNLSGKAAAGRGPNHNRGGAAANPGGFDHLSETIYSVCPADRRRDGRSAFRILVAGPQTTDSC